jgi:hypothetical protein
MLIRDIQTIQQRIFDAKNELVNLEVNRELQTRALNSPAAKQAVDEALDYDQWHAQQFAYLLGRLAEVDGGDGALLDTTEVLYGSCCSTTHNARNLPLALCGGTKLGIAHGGYTAWDEATPFSNVFVGMLNAVGVETEAFADSTGTLPEIFG